MRYTRTSHSSFTTLALREQGGPLSEDSKRTSVHGTAVDLVKDAQNRVSGYTTRASMQEAALRRLVVRSTDHTATINMILEQMVNAFFPSFSAWIPPRVEGLGALGDASTLLGEQTRNMETIKVLILALQQQQGECQRLAEAVSFELGRGTELEEDDLQDQERKLQEAVAELAIVLGSVGEAKDSEEAVVGGILASDNPMYQLSEDKFSDYDSDGDYRLDPRDAEALDMELYKDE
jgi:hypothetical protein